LDTTFDRNIKTLFEQEYAHYEIYFVVESTADPAYERLRQIIQERKNPDKVKAEIIVAGIGESSSQKLHNQLTAWRNLPDEIEALAFIDSDARLRKHSLANLIYPLHQENAGASTGYRWFVPTDNRLASITLSAMNAFFASVLGPHPWNSTWGGAMAIRRELFEKLDIPRIWSRACTDDYTLTRRVKEAQLNVIFVPACLLASYEKTSWKNLFGFARRQFVITRVYMPGLWQLALAGFSQFILGFWTGIIVTGCLWKNNSSEVFQAAILPGTLYFLACLKGILRQIMIRKIIPEDRQKLVFPGLIDIFLQPFLGIFTIICIIAAGISRKITWRGNSYILHGPEEIETLSRSESQD